MGMGNPILCDDAVGLRVARELEARLNQKEVTVIETSLAGLNLLDLLVGYDKLILVDAIQTDKGKAGQIHRLDPEALDTTQHATSTHDVSFSTALELGKKLGLALPREIVIFAVEVQNVSSFDEKCTPEVEAAISPAVSMIIEEINKSHSLN